MGYKCTSVKRKTVGSSVTGTANKAAHAWLWELCKVRQVASWTWTKGEGFRVAWTEETHRARSGRDAEWGALAILSADDVMEWCAERDPLGLNIPSAHRDRCAKFLQLDEVPAVKAKRATAAEIRKMVAELATLDLPDDARALLETIAA